MGRQTINTTLMIPLLACSQLTQGATLDSGRAEIQNIRVGLTPGRTRVVLDLSGPAAYKLEVLDNPARVVVDLPNAASSFDHRTVALQGTPIARIRSGVQPDSTLRYVFDITRDTRPDAFTLTPYQAKGHRLVLDLADPEATPASVSSEPSASPVTEPVALAAAREAAPMRTPQKATATSNPVAGENAGEWSGYISLDTRLFFHSPAFEEQDSQNVSVAFKPEYYIDWANGKQRFAFSPFLRYDANDDERTHADIRELYWRLEEDQFLFKAGLDVVFWGVAESRHLVDIINQTDLVEDIDGEEKLGQPMLNLDYMSDQGTWQFFLLPYFRERTFPGENGRLRSEPVVDTDSPVFESSDEEKHVDLAIRWSHYIGDWDIGLAHFSGTSREPLLIPSGSAHDPALLPLYLQIDQTSLDIQATKGAWLWKLEAIYNQNKLDDYYAYVGGLEYTHYGVAETTTDLGWLLEYNYDQRGENASNSLQNDIYFGMRLTGNDMAGSRLLAGVLIDVDTQSTAINIEAVRRLGESWTITLESRFFANVDRGDPLYFINADDYIELQLARFF